MGKDYQVVTVSFNPKETYELAVEKKKNLLEHFKSPSAGAAGWHFLTGREPAIRLVTDAVGFHYVYDDVTKLELAGDVIRSIDVFLGYATFKEELEGARIQYERRQVGREFVQQTARVVGGTGFVKNLSPGADKRTDPLEPILPPETKGTIHINFHLLLGRAEFPMMSVAKTLIHEASHKFLDTFDYAYGEEPHYRGMTEAQALRNADSYALAAVSLYRQTLIHDASELKDHSV